MEGPVAGIVVGGIVKESPHPDSYNILWESHEACDSHKITFGVQFTIKQQHFSNIIPAMTNSTFRLAALQL